eukprot:TRINITY_DN5413_c0_g1_i24.p1 TRINITY_DN5413_c0_g1~~TRINITY_DN5413_c0_g1_i24.p1  ORF type:complete len:729 (-),score=89.06 TRINITY_DN5413_c0_g1_i24:1521-3707(-)
MGCGISRKSSTKDNYHLPPTVVVSSARQSIVDKPPSSDARLTPPSPAIKSEAAHSLQSGSPAPLMQFGYPSSLVYLPEDRIPVFQMGSRKSSRRGSTTSLSQHSQGQVQYKSQHSEKMNSAISATSFNLPEDASRTFHRRSGTMSIASSASSVNRFARYTQDDYSESNYSTSTMSHSPNFTIFGAESNSMDAFFLASQVKLLSHASISRRTIRLFVSCHDPTLVEDVRFFLEFTMPRIEYYCSASGVALEIVCSEVGTQLNQEEKYQKDWQRMLELQETCDYYICFIGDNYGWIPANESIAAAKGGDSKKKAFLDGCEGKSLTEIEMKMLLVDPRSITSRLIIYSHETEFGNENARQHSLRDMISENTFCYISYENIQQLCIKTWKNLRATILRDFGQQPCHILRQKKWNSLYLVEAQNNKIERKDLLQKLESMAFRQHADNHHPIIVRGVQGCGKSTLLAMFVNKAMKRGAGKIIKYFPQSDGYSNTLSGLFETIWHETEIMSVTSKLAPEKSSSVMTFNHFQLICDALLLHPSMNYVIVVDALDEFVGCKLTDNPQNLDWIPSTLAKNISLIFSFTDGDLADKVHQKKKMEVIRMGGFNDLERAAYIDQQMENITKELPGSEIRLCDQLFSNNPLHLDLVFSGVKSLCARNIAMHLAEANVKIELQPFLVFLYQTWNNTYGDAMVKNTLQYLHITEIGITKIEMEYFLQKRIVSWSRSMWYCGLDL